MGAEKLAKGCDYSANGGSVPLPHPPPADIPHNATLEERRRIDDAVAVAASAEELPLSMVGGDGFRRPGTQ
jgi:hypothetical protein